MEMVVFWEKITNKMHNCDLTSIKGIECFEGILGNDILCNRNYSIDYTFFVKIRHSENIFSRPLLLKPQNRNRQNELLNQKMFVS